MQTPSVLQHFADHPGGGGSADHQYQILLSQTAGSPLHPQRNRGLFGQIGPRIKSTLASRKSGFLEAFSYFWNSWGTRLRQIKISLGISGIQSESTSWRHDSVGPDDQGAQIDLLIDRRDRVVNLCEIKFTNDPFTVSAKYAKELRSKEAVFKNKTGTKKAIFITLISAQGLEQNSHSVGLVSNTVTADALFS
jgi:hypothetical protein